MRYHSWKGWTIIMENILEVEGLSKIYKNGRGVSNITFNLQKGDVLGLLGPNGSGKTTTMKVICGLCHPKDGRVRIFGHSVYDEYEKAMENVGTLIEMPALYEHLTALENLKSASRMYKGIDKEWIDHILEAVHLSNYKNDKVARFSLGMKQRLGLALALISGPKLVILDEPANGLDIEGIIEVREIVRQMAEKKGVSFLISSHLAGEIEKTCNKVAVIYEGEMLSFDTVDEALRLNPTLEDFFLAKVKDKRGELII